MKIVGIIAEYNPFHKGHEFHLEKAKKITGADAAIIIMSGDYVQRGIDVYKRQVDIIPPLILSTRTAPSPS